MKLIPTYRKRGIRALSKYRKHLIVFFGPNVGTKDYYYRQKITNVKFLEFIEYSGYHRAIPQPNLNTIRDMMANLKYCKFNG